MVKNSLIEWTNHTFNPWWGCVKVSPACKHDYAEANLLAERFRNELGYRWAFPFAIHYAAKGGRTMYHMIHATDHPDASPLMLRAYRKVSGRPDWDRPTSQIDLMELLAETS